MCKNPSFSAKVSSLIFPESINEASSGLKSERRFFNLLVCNSFSLVSTTSKFWFAHCLRILNSTLKFELTDGASLKPGFINSLLADNSSSINHKAFCSNNEFKSKPCWFSSAKSSNDSGENSRISSSGSKSILGKVLSNSLLPEEIFVPKFSSSKADAKMTGWPR